MVKAFSLIFLSASLFKLSAASNEIEFKYNDKKTIKLHMVLPCSEQTRNHRIEVARQIEFAVNRHDDITASNLLSQYPMRMTYSCDIDYPTSTTKSVSYSIAESAGYGKLPRTVKVLFDKNIHGMAPAQISEFILKFGFYDSTKFLSNDDIRMLIPHADLKKRGLLSAVLSRHSAIALVEDLLKHGVDIKEKGNSFFGPSGYKGEFALSDMVAQMFGRIRDSDYIPTVQDLEHVIKLFFKYRPVEAQQVVRQVYEEFKKEYAKSGFCELPDVVLDILEKYAKKSNLIERVIDGDVYRAVRRKYNLHCCPNINDGCRAFLVATTCTAINTGLIYIAPFPAICVPRIVVASKLYLCFGNVGFCVACTQCLENSSR